MSSWGSLSLSLSLSAFFVSICVFFSASLSPLSMCVVLCCQPTISDPFLRFTANFTPSSLCRFNPSIIPLFILPQFEAELSAFHRKIQMKLSHFYAFFPLNLVHRLLPYLNFYNTSPLAPLCCLFLSPLLVCTCHPPPLLLLLFSWQALPTDVAAYVALTGPKQRAACARSG